MWAGLLGVGVVLAVPAFSRDAAPRELLLVELEGGREPPPPARTIGEGAGDIRVVEVPRGGRDRLARAAGVRAVSRGGAVRPTLDRSVVAVGVPALRDALDTAGEGALVAIVDTGIDARHPDLLDPAGRPRVAWIADLSEAPRGVHPELERLVEGAVYGPEEIAQAVASGQTAALGGRDRIGHGTHVASIAAGARGAAPGATLVVVKASRAEEGRFEEADVVLATRFCFALADRLDAPIVVNLSLGGDDGPHDGRSLFERALTDTLEQQPEGRAIVAAAGNGAYQDGHASAWLAPAEPAVVGLSIPRPRAGGPEATVRIVAMGVEALDARPPDGTDALDARVEPLDPSGLALVLRAPAPGHWLLTAAGAGRADLWVAETDLVGPLGSTPRFTDHVDPGGQVTIPATAEGVLAVGSWASRVEYRDRDGDRHATPTASEGDVSAFSARGPTRDGRPKPDLVAPGEAIVAALASDLDADASAFRVGPDPLGRAVDDEHAVLWGTSAAAAHASGLAALLFSRDPTLPAEAVGRALAGGAAPRDERAWSVATGWGALDAGGALAVFEGRSVPRTARIAVVPDVAAPGAPVRILVSGATEVEVRALGAIVPVRPLGAGRFEATWSPPARALGSAVAIDAVVDGRPLEALVEVAERRGDLGAAPRVRGGGCAVPGADPPAPSHLLLLVLVAAGALELTRRAPTR